MLKDKQNAYSIMNKSEQSFSTEMCFSPSNKNVIIIM